ncbi:MAG: hypothetical protein J2P47_06540 [Acetobacteraceae bacterium]|nr:hypothetical protein [Acetobacteraceae bacterium]
MSKLPPVLALLVLSLAGCQSWNAALLNTISTLPSAQPRDLVNRIDGNYKGPARLVRASAPGCPPGSFGTVRVGDRTLYFAYAPNIIFIAPVFPDGTLHAVSGGAVLDGVVGGGRLFFTVRTADCDARYNLRWVL